MRIFTCLLSVFIVSQSWAAKKERTLPNCVSIYENRVFMSVTEVSNISYREFLYYQKSHGEDVSTLLPDTLVWKEKNVYNEPYVDYYFRHPAYNDYPVVGVNKVQAEAFCAWLSKILIENCRRDPKSDIDSLVVRLPNQMEWIDAAKGVDKFHAENEYNEYPWKGHSLRMEDKKFQGQMRANFVRGKGDFMGVAGALNDNADITAPVKSYWTNDLGLYNCAGNVAEMVADKSVAMGGSWRSSGYNIKVTSSIPFEAPSSQVGFRYLIEVVKLKPKSAKPNVDLSSQSFKKKYLSQVNDTLWASKFEVTNELYNLFLKEAGHEVQDTTVWNEQFPYSNWFTCNYRWHPDYANYPAVGMKRSDAEAFCSWMGRKMTSLLGVDAQVEIPSESTWELLARGGLQLTAYPWGGPYLRNAKGALLANFRYIPESFEREGREEEYSVVYPPDKHQMYGADFDGFMGPAPEEAYHPNGWGVFQMAGNAKELVAEKEITKGGGWHSLEHFLVISAREPYDEKPAADVGFRFCVMTKSGN